jgi:HSP20 family molecular chaperone IbpA
MADKVAALQTDRSSTTLQLTHGGIEERIKEVFDLISRRAYELFDKNGRTLGRDREDWLKAEAELLHPVHVEVSEADGSLKVQAEVPGFSDKEVEVTVEPWRVVIAGERKSSREEKHGKTIYNETCAGQVLRVINLPAEINAAKATATLKNGVVEVYLPKAEALALSAKNAA